MAVFLAFKYYKKSKLFKFTFLFNFYSNVTWTIQFFIPPWITITFPIIADTFVIAIDITWTVKHCKNNRIGLRFSEKEILSISLKFMFCKIALLFCVSFSGERKIDRVYFLENLGYKQRVLALSKFHYCNFLKTFQKHLVYATLGQIPSLLQFFTQNYKKLH